ncbi:transglutaminase domain-containing protein [Methanobacterium sp.]|uniref:transglutaminase domain-containing protein n=1 Tax=Methanobacterium sp. TaxID=2164 RepID=UPI003C7359F4
MEKCVVCGKRKGKRPCLTNGGNLICTLCCGSNKSWDYCNTLCEKFPEEVRENIFEDLFGIKLNGFGWMSYDTGEITRSTLNCFLPNIYEYITCIVKNLSFKFLNSQTISVEAILNLKSDHISDEIYFKDKWKKEENWGYLEGLYDYYPLFLIFTEGKNKVYPLKTELKIDNNNLDITDSNVHWTVGLPFSKVKTKSTNEIGPTGMTTNHEEYMDGKGFLGTNYIVFSSIQFNRDLKLNFIVSRQDMDINSSDLKLNFPIKLFFPFKNVIIENINYSAPPDFELNKDPSIALYNPSNKLRVNRIPIFPQMTEDITYDSIENHSFSNKINLNSYKILELNFELIPTVKREAVSFITTYPIPSSIYNSINKLYSEKFAPAIVIISNYSDNTIRASIIAEIQEISNIFEKDIVIGPYSQETVRITPTLNINVIENLHDIMDTSMTVKVESDGEIILRSNEPIQVLARDTIIWEIEDPGRSWAVDLSNLIISWITPHTPAVDKIISSAARKIGAIGDFSDDNSLENEIRAIYDTISEDIRYVNRLFSFGDKENVSTQRILSPKQTLTERSGNCIDLAVLFASCLEAIGINPLIVLVPHHAFVGWEGYSSSKFLETTFMGEEDFDSAIEEGMKRHAKYDPTQGEIRVINVEEIRNKEIYPPKWFS